jgi:membrane-bound lytic murein transglycosylase D
MTETSQPSISNKTHLLIALGAALVASVVAGFVGYSYAEAEGSGGTRKPGEPIYGDSLTYRITSPPIPEGVEFCGEAVPLEDFEVYERLDREIIAMTFLHSQTIGNLKRANRFFPTIERILAKNDVPGDFKYLAVCESNLKNLVSYADAHGYWQFLERTGERYGLRIDDEVDERYHLEKSTQAACDYLKDSHKRYQDWTLAAASYNAGPRRITEELREQKATNYYDLKLVNETARYVPRIVATKTVFENPESYGFHIPPEDLYPEPRYREIEVTKTIPSLVAFAKERGASYKTLKYCNQWLRSDRLTVREGERYTILLPE